MARSVVPMRALNLLAAWKVETSAKLRMRVMRRNLPRRAGVNALNARLGQGSSDRFHLFHRRRQWNAGEGSWIGWERKRGKIEEFNRLLRGATDTSYQVHVGDPAILPSVRYCITLDSDTRLPLHAARKLIGIIAHPLNRPSFDPHRRRVTEGYGILQPRVSVTMASAAGSLFARVYAGPPGWRVAFYSVSTPELVSEILGQPDRYTKNNQF